MECDDQIFTPTNSAEIPCDGDFRSTECVLTPTALPYLNITANSTQAQINTALILALQALTARVEELENQI